VPDPVDIARPVSYDACYGAGLDRAICLGGGGVFFVAWQVGYLRAVADAGLDLGLAERVVGTSAGSIVATTLLTGRLGWIHGQLSALGRFPAIVSALAPAGGLSASQVRAQQMFVDATDAAPDTIRAIGHAALAAATPESGRMRRNLALVLQNTSWPDGRLHITAVDAYTGERCVITKAAGVRTSRAAAASSAVPGLFPTQIIADRRLMDGGVSGSGTHLDLVAGARRVLVLSVVDGTRIEPPQMTTRAEAITEECARVEAAGGTVFLRAPSQVEVTDLMSPDVIPRALRQGAEQAQADLPALRDLWA
jgi:NTE family protein